jgi:phosphomannomutase
MPDIIFSVSGVRGIYGDSLTLPVAVKYTMAFAKFCRDNHKSKKIIVGSDGRLKGEEIASVVMYALAFAGFEVVDIGVVPTPTVQLAVEKLKAAGGIAITASHNPQQWNGLKFLDSDGTFLKPDQIAEVKKNLNQKKFKLVGFKNIKPVKQDLTWIDKHIDLVLKSGLVSISKVRKRRFKVVVDAVNSSGSVIVPKLLRKLGCDVIELYCDGSGIFPHLPEPLPQNLTLLSKAVKKNNADIGVAIDPDGDRLVLICETGKPFIEENTIVAVIRNILRNAKGRKCAVVNMSTTRAVNDVVKENGGTLYRTAVGEINVVTGMKHVNAVVGGEGSGGVIIPEIHYGRDASVGLAIVLNELAEFKGKMSEYKKTIPGYFILKSKFETAGNPSVLLNKIKNLFSSEDCSISAIDGIKLDFPDYWIHLRKSNTEPIIRIIIEAKSESIAEKLMAGFLKKINIR